MYPRGDVLAWVVRLSTRIFNGPELSDNEQWLRLSVEYAVNVFKAIEKVKMYPPGPIRWLAERFLPICVKIRKDYKMATRIVMPIVEERRVEIEAAAREGRPANVPDDSIEWFRNSAKGRPYDDVQLQLGLGLAAVHTTSDLLGQAVLNLATYPEYTQAMREEVVSVITKYGWKKIALNELRLIDSFLKETQRLKPITMGKQTEHICFGHIDADDW